MRAYLIVPPGTDQCRPDVDALVLDSSSPSVRAVGEAIQGRRPAGADEALDPFASLAMTEAGTGACKPRLLVRVEGIEAPDLDASLAVAAALRPDAIVLPACHGRDVAHLGSRLAVLEAEHGLPDGGIGIIAFLTCAAGTLAAESFVGSNPRLRGLGWDAEALAGQLGMRFGFSAAKDASRPRPHREVPQRSEGLEGALQGSRTKLAPSFEARLRIATQDEGAGGTRGARPDPWASSPVLAEARAKVRLAAAAAGVEAIEAMHAADDPVAFSQALAAARRDGFGAMFARDVAQVRLIRAEA